MMDTSKRVVVFLFLIAVLSACGSHANFIPEQERLSSAFLGKFYVAQINIIGGRVITSDNRSVGFIEPEGSGLFLQNCKLPSWKITGKTTMAYDGNCIQVKGTPAKLGLFKVTIGGSLYGNMFIGPESFKKTYTINIIDPGV